MGRTLTAGELERKALREEAPARKATTKSQKLRSNAIVDQQPTLLPSILARAERLARSGGTGDHAGGSGGADAADGSRHSGDRQSAPSRAESLRRPLERHNYKMGKLPLQDLKFLLSELSPPIFTPWNLKALMRKGQRDVSREELCKLIELVSGVGEEAELGKGFFRTLGDVLAFLKSGREDLGGHIVLPRCVCLKTGQLMEFMWSLASLRTKPLSSTDFSALLWTSPPVNDSRGSRTARWLCVAIGQITWQLCTSRAHP